MKGTREMTYVYDVNTEDGQRAKEEYFKNRDEWGFKCFKLLGGGRFELTLPEGKVPPAGVLGNLRAV